jgi:uncharacterized protein YbjT (DUF2867 family)
MAAEKTALVIGATGQQGGATARHLLDRGWRVRAFVRAPEQPAAQALADRGAVLARGDLDDAGSLGDGLTGVDAVFSVQTFTGPGGVAAEERRGRLVADLVAELGIGHLVYSSVGGAERHTGIPHFESKAGIEEHIRELGLPATILRPTFLMENLSAYFRPQEHDGEIVVTLGLEPGTALQVIAVDDIGAIAVEALDRPDESLGTAVEIAGDEVTGEQIARTFGGVLGVPARFRSLPIPQLRAVAGDEMADMFQWFNTSGYQADIPALRTRYPFLSTLEDWVKANRVPAPP